VYVVFGKVYGLHLVLDDFKDYVGDSGDDSTAHCTLCVWYSAI